MVEVDSLFGTIVRVIVVSRLFVLSLVSIAVIISTSVIVLTSSEGMEVAVAFVSTTTIAKESSIEYSD